MKKIIINLVACCIMATTIQAQVAYKYFTINGEIHTLLGPNTNVYNTIKIYSNSDGGNALPTTNILIDKYIHFNFNYITLPGFAITNNANCYHLQHEWFGINEIGITPTKDFVATINTTNPNELAYTIMQSANNGKTFNCNTAVVLTSKSVQLLEAISTSTNAVQLLITDNATGSKLYQSPVYYTNIFANVYPTLVSTITNIDVSAAIATYNIINSAGVVVAQGKLQQFHNRIDVSTLPIGNYFIKIIDESSNKSTTALIQKVE